MSIKYRPDIDGLRAVAVIAVVLFHAGFKTFSGGFIGVDVFFVISGFLITSIIYPEIIEHRFSLISFYDRRVRRLFPALILVLMITSTLACLILTPGELVSYGKSIATTAAFASNIYFWRVSGYFGQAAHDLPLLHTWTLAVEEQFYIFFPLFLILVSRWARKHTANAIIALVLFASLVLAEYGVRGSYAATFYLLPTRAWELLLGALIALPIVPLVRPSWAPVIGVCGLVMLVAPFFTYSSATPFPGLYAVPPCLGTALVIYSGRDRGRSWVGRFLALPPAVYIGRISYSLYLWHWPLLVLASLFVARALSEPEAIAVVLLCVVLSAVSWRYVETPLRGRARLGGNARLRVLVGVGSMAIVILGGCLLVAFDGLSFWAPDVVLQADRAIHDINSLQTTCISNRGALPPVKPCLVGPSAKEGTYQVIVWGDSHADHYFPAVVEALKDRNLTVRQVVRSSCPPILDVKVNASAEPNFAEECAAFNAAVWQTIREADGLKLVVLASYWTTWSESPGLTADGRPVSIENSRRLLTSLLTRTVTSITDLGVSVLLMGQAPAFQTPPAPCLARAAMFGRDLHPCIDTPASAFAASTRFSNQLIAALESSDPKVKAFFPGHVLCGEESCRAFQDGVMFYRDRHHLTATGARYLGPFIQLPPVR